MPFQVIPAIDIQGGKAVRLRQGRAEDATVFSDSPLDVARRFASAGASRLHVVDLDGAFLGKPVNADIICRIAAAAGIPVQVGGGVRNFDTAARYFAAGIARVILGTSIVRDPEEVVRITRASIPAATFPGYARVIRTTSSGSRTMEVPRITRAIPAAK